MLLGVALFIFVASVTLTASLLIKVQPTLAATSSTLNFQARLESASGSIAPDGNYDVTFHLFNSSTAVGGTSTDATCGTDTSCLWEETYSYNSGPGASDARVHVVNGYLTVNLGSITAFGALNWNQQMWLTMDIGGTTSSGAITWDGQMSPRIQLTAVPYSFTSGSVSTTDGSGHTGILSFPTSLTNSTDAITLPDASGTVCLQTSSSCGFATGSGVAFLQGGNNFSANAVLGTNGAGQTLALQTAGTQRVILDATGNLQFQQASTINIASAATGTQLTIQGGAATSGTNVGGNLLLQGGAGASTGASGSVIVKANTHDSTTAFQVQNAAGTATLLNADTTNLKVTVAGDIVNTFNSSPGLVQLSSTTTFATNPAWVTVQGKYAYIIEAGGTQSLEILDITNPSSPVRLGTLGLSAASPNQIQVVGRYAYIAEQGASNAGVLEVVDLSNKQSPTSVATLSTGSSPGPSGVTVSGNYAYIADSNTNDMAIVNVSNPTAPKLVSTIATNTSPRKIAVQGKYAYVISCGGATPKLQSFDISNPASPSLLSSSNVGQCAANISIEGRYAYVTGISSDGELDVFDISNPASIPAAVYQSAATHAYAWGNALAGRYIFTSSTTAASPGSIAVTDLSNPTSPSVLQTYTDGGAFSNPRALFLSGRNLFMIDKTNNKLFIFDVSGLETTAATIHSLEAGTLTVDTDASVANNLTIGNWLGVGQGGITTSGNLAVGAGLLTVDTANQTTTLRAGSDTSASTTLYNSNNYTSGWTTTGWTATATSATHTTGNTNALVNTSVSVTAGATYIVDWATSGSCGGSPDTITVSIGGTTLKTQNGNTCGAGASYIATATTTAGLTITPTTNWAGAVTWVSIYQVTSVVNPALVVQNTSSAASLEVRASSGASSTYIGLNSGTYDQGSTDNTALGVQALQYNTWGDNNAAVGTQSLQHNTEGFQNVAVGESALFSNTSGHDNVGIGNNVMTGNISGYGNIALGSDVFGSNTLGNVNVTLGGLSSNTTGSGNVGVGFQAFNSNTTGSNNTGLGYDAGYQDLNGGFKTLSTLQNATAIGAYAQVQASNSIVLGSVDNATLVGVGITVPSNTFSVSPLDYQTGTVTRTNSSATLTGTSTAWVTAGVVPGDIIIFADGTTNTIASIGGNTTLTMGTTYTGTTDASPVHYRFHHVGLQVTSGGMVGIGLTSPGHPLVVQGPSGSSTTTEFQATDGTQWLMLGSNLASGSYNPLVAAGSQALLFSNGSQNTGNLVIAPWSTCSGGCGLVVSSSGNVGIGTASPSHALTVTSNNDQPITISANYSNSFGHAVMALNSGLGVGQNYLFNIGVAGSNFNSGYVGFNYAGGAGSTSNFVTLGLWGADNKLNVLGNGDVGIGTTTSTHALQIAEDVSPVSGLTIGQEANAQFVISGATNHNQQLRLAYDTTNNFATIQSTVFGSSSNTLALNPDGGDVSVGTTAPSHLFQVGASCTTIGTHSCVDYAEYYNSSDLAAPGDVMVTDTNSPSGKLIKESSTPYDPHVIGVVSTNPAFVIEEGGFGIGGQQTNGGVVAPSYKPPIALAGRIPVKVSTINGPITVGDAITTSALPGFGMKSTQAGPTVGKAMQAFNPTHSDTGEEIIDCPSGTPPGVICGEIFVYANTSWYDPNAGTASIDSVQIVANPQTGTGMLQNFTVTDAAGNQISGTDSFQGLAVGELRAGSIQVQQIVTGSLAVTSDQLTIAGQSLRNFTLSTLQDALSGGSINGVSRLQSLEVSGDGSFQGNLLVAGHIITGGVVPAVSALAATGTDVHGNISGTCDVSGDDTSGTLTITTGIRGLTAGAECSLTFSQQFAAVPHPVAGAVDRASAGMGVYIAATQTGVTLYFSQQPAAGQTYTFNYWNAQ